jgi:predicted transcriptional regulator
MTQLLDKALQAARTLPAVVQDEIARTILLLAEEESEPVRLTAAEREAIAGSKAAAARGEFATDEEVEAVWAKYGL